MVIERHGVVQRLPARRVRVVINDVHDDSDTRVVQRHNHLFKLVYSHCAVGGVGRERTLGDIVVLRVVTPVKVVFCVVGFV